MRVGESDQLVVLNPTGAVEDISNLEPFLGPQIFGPLADGKYIAIDTQVRRLLPDGSVDPTYKTRVVTPGKWSGPFGVDALGRVYFQAYGTDNMTFEGVEFGAFGRLERDGNFDLGYRPFPTATEITSWHVRPDSSALIYSWNFTWGAQLFRVSPDGIPTLVGSDNYQVNSVELLENDWIHLTSGWCGWGHCAFQGIFIAPDGRRLEGFSSNWLEGRSVLFHGTEYIHPEPGAITFGSLVDRPAVGWMQGEIFAANSNLGLGLQRAGPTTDPLAVLCQITAVDAREGPVEPLLRTVTFEATASSARLDLSFLRSDAANSVRQFDISIINAPGIEVPFPTTRLVIVPDPPKSGLAIHPIGRAGYPATAVLIVDPSFPNDAYIQQSRDLNGWDRITYGALGSSDAPYIEEIWPEQDVSFYRLSNLSNR